MSFSTGTGAVSRTVEVYRRLAAAPAGRLYGIPRGGAIVAGLTGRAVDRIEDADWIVDDFIDTGLTKRKHAGDKPLWALYDTSRDGIKDGLLLFPWDRPTSGADTDRLERVGHELLEALGYDVRLPGLMDTPRRWAHWWHEFLAPSSNRVDVSFSETVVGQLVLVSGVQTWSVCEHHLLPFKLDISIGYVPEGSVLGLSKFVRLVNLVAHRLQLQERIVEELADITLKRTRSDGVAVLAKGRHLCMEVRGVRSQAVTTSLATRGRFERDSQLRQDFLFLATGSAQADGL
jgi:GTP cyclohydrolase I